MSSPRTKLKEKESAARTAPPAGPDRFFNRELSWLQFNRRVLEEALNQHHPLLERLRFLSISASNLDEFYMVRAAGLYGQVAAGVTQVSQDGLTPAQQLTEINKFAAALASEQYEAWAGLKSQLSAAGIDIVERKELTPAEQEWLQRRVRRALSSGAHADRGRSRPPLPVHPERGAHGWRRARGASATAPPCMPCCRSRASCPVSSGCRRSMLRRAERLRRSASFASNR